MDTDGSTETPTRSNGISRKRVRATQACVLCRKKKIKCDGTKPECLHCQETNTQCEYAESKKRGPRKGYVQLLEERLGQMERQFIRLGTTSTMLNTDGSGCGSSSDEAPTSVPLQSILPTASSYKQDPAQHIVEEDDGLPPKDVIIHLVDLYFKYINATLPIVHRQTLMKSIEDGTVSKPLLWSVLAIGARYSDDPSIKTDPPYWAGERFAAKAHSLIDGSMLEPSLPNLQFWHIMACLEYGRASGAKAWIYAGLAVRFCQELGLNKEEALSTLILSKEGTIDTVAMALRRRIFWSCFCIDKFCSAGTSRPQGFLKADIDANPPNIPESLVIRDPNSNISVSKKPVVNDSLMDVGRHFMKVMQLFGEGNSIMSRTRSDSSSIVWPPVPEYTGLDTNLRLWKDNLPERFQFTPSNLDFHKDNSSFVYFTMWLSMHAVWCSSLMVLHRGSLAYGDIRAADVDQDVYRAIQLSIETCKMSVRTATGVFRAMRDLCGCNVLPYMGYSAYVFATVLMTSTFSKGPDACRRSGAALKVLYDLIDTLRPYWPMCERLASTTADLLVAHSRLYQPDQRQGFPYDDNTTSNNGNYAAPSSLSIPTDGTNSVMTTPPRNYVYPKHEPYFSSDIGSPIGTLPPMSLSGRISSEQHQQQQSVSFAPNLPSTSHQQQMQQQSQQRQQQQQQQQQQPFQSILNEELQNYGAMPGDIDFDSLDFLNDSALFGQIMFDASRPSIPPSTLASTFAYPTMHSFVSDNSPSAQTLLSSQSYTPGSSPTRPWNTPT